MSETPPVVTPHPYPTPPPNGNSGPGWIVTILIGIVAFLMSGQLRNPVEWLPPEQPPAVDPGPVEPTPADPGLPLVPDTPPVVEPEPQPPPKPLDETAAIARYAAEMLSEVCRQDFAKMAEAAASCADRIDAGHIRTEADANGWLRVENRSAATDYAEWVPFFRAMQSRFRDLRTVGRMATLEDWAREFRSMSDGLAAASVGSLSMEPPADE